MNPFLRTALIVFLASIVAGIVAQIAGARVVASCLIVPAFVMAAWAFIGHLVTLDDDSPGGWSNPDGSKAMMRASLRDLSLKALVFAAVASLFVWIYSGL